MINDLYGRGYFGRTLPERCVDNYNEINPADVLAERLGIPDLWPLRPKDWDEDTFFGLIEVFHDLAVRPRKRSPHGYGGSGWHYSAFATDTGRALYRWKINRLLESAGIELRLAEDGEDIGRLVHLVDDARTELVERTLGSPDPRVSGRVGHAIALFRGRAATEHDKRSAIVTLHLVLEERRKLLKASLFRKDEGACFRSRTSSTCAIRSPVTTTRHFWTGCSGGTWPPSSSPTRSSPARPPRPPPRRRDH